MSTIQGAVASKRTMNMGTSFLFPNLSSYNVKNQSIKFSAYESRENLDSFSLSILSELSKTEYVRQNSKKKF